MITPTPTLSLRARDLTISVFDTNGTLLNRNTFDAPATGCHTLASRHVAGYIRQVSLGHDVGHIEIA